MNRSNRKAHERHRTYHCRASATPAAREHAERNPDDRCEREGRNGQHSSVQGSAQDESTYRPVVEERITEVEAHRARKPRDPLSARTAIQIESRACTGNFGGARKRPELRRDVARRQPSEKERRR
jgi:hypothetical protein